MRTPVIIDTDPGLDDAVAILYALRAPAFEVLGLTTLAGNVGLDRTTANAGSILALAGSSAPVIRGAAAPLHRAPFPATEVHGADGLGGVDLPVPRYPAQEDAVEWMARTLETRAPASVDLLALGPLTNVARLLAERPGAARRLRRIIAMGGAVDDPGNVSPRAEFNMAADPEAAAAVLSAGLNLVLVPLDVTRKVRAHHSDCARLAASPRPEARAAAALIEAYFQSTTGHDSRPLHDPCVMLLVDRPELFTLRRRALTLDVSDGPDAGALCPGGPEVTVALGVQGPAALARIVEVLTGEAP